MRDAFGGVFMIRLLLVFIVIYVAFTAISLNYAKAFRVKNKVISFVEENEILNIEDLFNDKVNNSKLNKLANILKKADYSVKCANDNGKIKDDDEPYRKRYCYNGIIIEEKKNDNKDDRLVHYEITTFVRWNLNFMNRLLMLSGQNPSAKDVIEGSWAITGEAKVVKNK